MLINHKLVGSHAISHRINQLGLNLDSSQIQVITQEIKVLAEQKKLTPDKIDEILLSYSGSSQRSSC